MNERLARPTQSHAIALAAGLVLGAGLIPVAGCASPAALPWQKPSLPAEPGAYKSAEIGYQIDAGRLSLPMAIARVEARQISFEEVVSRPEAGRASGRLSIRYPHPDGRTDVAQAQVEIQNDSRPPVSYWRARSGGAPSSDPANESVCYEQWQLDMPKADLDRLLDQLRRDGCFTQEQPQATGARLTLGFDGRRVTKPWTQSATLEIMMQRVRIDGQLVALRRPATPAGRASITSSLVSYRNLVQQGGGGDSPQALSLAVNGLLVPNAPAAAGPTTPSGPPAAPPTTEIARMPSGAH